MSQSQIGYLDRLDENGHCTASHEIFTAEEIFIGRNKNSCRVVVDAPWISNKHMRLYSIIYEPGVEPFLYVEDISSQGNNTWLYKRGKYWERCVLDKSSIKLLSHGDRLRLCDGTIFAFRSIHTMQYSSPEEKDELRELERDSFSNLYYITKRLLGSGGSATVFMAIDRWNNKQQVACKIVKSKRSRLGPTTSHHFQNNQGRSLPGIEANSWESPESQRLRQEVAMLRTLSHPNIIELQRVFYTNHTLYLIEDLVTGGDLASYIEQENEKLGAVYEEDACMIVYQLLKALSYLHDHGVAHRDVKPENVLMSIPTVGARVLLTDFGAAAGELKTRPRRLKTLCGTAEWVAPEVSQALKEGYTMAVDMWSLGCLITALFSGMSIFATAGEQNARHSTLAIRTAAAKCDLSALNSSQTWQNVDARAKDLTKRLLVLDEKTRMTANQALQHGWFCQGRRQKNIERYYEIIIAPWKPKPPTEDFFEEDLKVFIQAGIGKDDARRRVLSYSPPSPKQPLLPKADYPYTKKLKIEDPVSKEHSLKQRWAPVRDSSFMEAPDEFKFGSTCLGYHPATKELRIEDRVSKGSLKRRPWTPAKDSSFMEAPGEFNFGSGGLGQPQRRRKSTASTNQEDHALRTQAWGGNRGLMSAKDYDRKIHEKRKEAAVG